MSKNSLIQNIWNFTKGIISKCWQYIVIAILAIICILAINKCSDNSARYEHNLKALIDTISYHNAKHDSTLVASKLAYEASIDELKLLDRDLYDKIENLDIKPKNVITTTYVQGETIYMPQDTVWKVDSSAIAHGFDRGFAFNDEWRTLEGTIKYRTPDTLKLNIDKDIMKFDYTIAMDKDNRIHIHSSNPYVHYNEISGFIVPKSQQKKQKFHIGPSIGASYNIRDHRVDPYIGVGITWSIIRF